MSNKCYTILKLISRGLIICIVYYSWINAFWEIVAGQWTIQLQNRTFSMSFLKSKRQDSRLFIANIEYYINYDWYKYQLELYNQIKYIKLKKAFEFSYYIELISFNMFLYVSTDSQLSDGVGKSLLKNIHNCTIYHQWYIKRHVQTS